MRLVLSLHGHSKPCSHPVRAASPFLQGDLMWHLVTGALLWWILLPKEFLSGYSKVCKAFCVAVSNLHI